MKTEAQGARAVRPLMSAALEAVGLGGEGGKGVLAATAAAVGLSLTRLVY